MHFNCIYKLWSYLVRQIAFDVTGEQVQFADNFRHLTAYVERVIDFQYDR
jgi:hypothetical protein